MSLARTALRLQGVLTLLADPVIDALCQGRIYDSRIGQFDHREPVPTIILTTEEDDAPAWSKNNGGAPFNHTCDLVLEIAHTMLGDIVDGSGLTVEAIGNPATDSELEAYLDLIEEAAVSALTIGETPEARLLVDAVTRRVTKVKSSRFSTEQGVRLAIRLVTLSVELKGEDPDDIVDPPSGPYATLPDPLRSVARAMPADYSGRRTVDLLAGLMPTRTIEGQADAPLYASLDLAPQRLISDTPPDPHADAVRGILVGSSFTFGEP